MFWWILLGAACALAVYLLVVYAQVRSLDAGLQRTWARIQEQLTQRESAVRELIALARELPGNEPAWRDVQSVLERARDLHDSPLAASQIQDVLARRTAELVSAMPAHSEAQWSLRMDRALKTLTRCEDRIARFRRIFERSVRKNNALRKRGLGGLVARLLGCRLREYYPADDRLIARSLREDARRIAKAERQ